MLRWEGEGGDSPGEVDEMAAALEDVMLAVAQLVEERGGEARTTVPGQLIKEIAEDLFNVEIVTPFHRSREYVVVARAIVALEEIGLLSVERVGWHHSERASKLIAVRLITD